MLFSLNKKLVSTLLLSTLAILSFAGRVLALSPCPNKSEQSNINLGIVTTNPFSACVGGGPTGEECTNLSFSGPGAFSMQHTFSFSVNCSTVTDLVTFTGTFGVAGTASLKYVVLGVDYAPPGAKSTVNYAGSSLRGTSISTAQSFTNASSVSTSGDGGIDLFGIISGTGSGTASASYTSESDSSSSLTVQTTTTDGDTIPGPSSSAAGVDHDADIIWVWLNPQIPYTVVGATGAANSILQGNYQSNPADPVGEMDVVSLPVIWLENPSMIPSDVLSVLARSWDTSGVGALTTADYAAILAQDPLAAGSAYNPNTDPNHRFDLQVGSDFTYEPSAQGLNPNTQTFGVSAQSTSAAGQGASTSYSVGASFTADAQANFIVDISGNVKVSNTITNTSKWSSLINSATTKTASLSITGPAFTDNYTGPIQMQVWRDNIYGSFMFFPIE